MPNPTILIVPGSFAGPGIYDGLVKLLKDQGFPALALQLPSTQKRMPLPPATMQEDAETVRRAVEMLVGLGREVVVLCHSYGGTPTTEGLAGQNVKRIIYLTAIAPRVGQTHFEDLEVDKAMLPPVVEGYMHMDALQMAAAVLNDLPFEDAYPLALQLPHHSVISFNSPITKAAYEKIPVTYIVTEKDLIVPPKMQRKFISTIEEVSGKSVDVRTMECGHCPQWSCPEKLVEVVVEAARLE